MDDAVEKLRDALTAKPRGAVQGHRLAERLMRATGLGRDVVLESLNALRQTGEVVCADWHRREPIGKVTLNIQRTRSEAQLRWLAVLSNAGLATPDIDALLPAGDSLRDWREPDLKRLLQGLLALRQDLPQLHGESRYPISARYLLGSSKLLDALPNAPLKAFGIDPTVLAGATAYVLTAGAPNPECVVLVENPQALEAALRVTHQVPIAWVATYGYGLSRAGDEYGRQLLGLIESGNRLNALIRSGQPPDIATLLGHPNLYFWGDLDREGLRIYWRLKQHLPQLRLSGLYRPMVEFIRGADSSHPYTERVAKATQSHWECPEDPQIQALLKVCLARAVDQEALGPASIAAFAHTAFERL